MDKDLEHSDLLIDYSVQSKGFDEMWTKNGKVRPHWQQVIRCLNELGSTERHRRHQEARRLLLENGVTYNVHGDPKGQNRPWNLDLVPLVINDKEWRNIEAGVVQRAELLNLVLADVYGPKKLLKNGLIPPELIYSPGGFLRQCDQIRLPGSHQLILYGVDLVRDSDRKIWVLNDRTQAPLGAGYALENRITMGRIFSNLIGESHVCRLASFFHSFRQGLESLSPKQKDDPKIVILTPGPQNENYFENAYLASYLGYTLVQGDDLIVRDGCVWLKSVDGLQLVDIILRRVDDWFCDPLELCEESNQGVAGLLEAVRRRNVAVANPLGSSVVENPGLMPFLPDIARHLLGEELKLPSAASWWCGKPKELNYVLQNLENLIIKPIYRHPGSKAIFCRMLSNSELNSLRLKIQTRPHLFVAQEQVGLSTSPTLIEDRLEPRHSMLRCLVTANNGNYTVMPGGLAVSAVDKDNLMLTYLRGGISKDTWVLTSKQQKHVSVSLQLGKSGRNVKSSFVLTSKGIENLFWVGRYAERAEATTRLLRTILKRLNESIESGDPTESQCLKVLFSSLTHMTDAYPGFTGDGGEDRLGRPEEELLSIILDAERNGGLATTLQYLVQAAYRIRDRWSTDTWRIINSFLDHWMTLQTSKDIKLDSIQNDLDRMITGLGAFTGLTTESMTREPGWIFLETGRRIERGLLLISVLRSTLVHQQEKILDLLVMESVLATMESLITYRYNYRSYLQLETVLELLLFDSRNPRSLIYQFDQLQQHIAKLPRDRQIHGLSKEEKLILEAVTLLRLSELSKLAQIFEKSQTYKNLDVLLSKLSQLLIQISEILTQVFFSHLEEARQLLPTGQER